ncbi:hypothetical protein A2W39_03320 [Candidatus Azambacteria bacterium RIFCSPHIGHO2_01_46_10]|uniref:Methyltransferase domain-containing protein n=3 Tax=Candidatus Azamiibacteriota TaxID=1752741 RepID=A0A1F5C7S1_9BACT|nr:MAG: hypothetical protein A2W60_00495 [Candidatus Azambacteria bacterium RIFCSPHIGHO2_02_46_12]OGD35727.1 MAG: hypothetical protein A2W39_03320 [Candidatus Azambacteria bacterium RIFCSPHIGHO2_01_46_10]OGD38895.1 MAG: hypothetical protein A3A25_02185 [Candidatus Azambacteria bacterium RIFCSPLOWO2_01_FULL_46_26]
MEFIHPEEIIKELNLKPGIKIADFGSGSGVFTILLAKAIAPEGKIYALDVLKETLDVIQTKAKSEGLFNVETIWANLEAKGGSKLPDDSQDLVMIANVLFQSTMKSNILSEAKRILSPAGKLAVIDWRPDAKGVGPEEGYRLSPQECVKIASELGFKLDKEFVAGAYHWGLILTK